MSVDTGTKKPAGPTFSDIERGLAQWGNLKAELEALTRQRAELKTVVEYAVASEALPRLQAAGAEAKAQAETILATAREEAARIVSESEEKARGIVAEAEAVKSQVTQAASRLIGDAKRQAILEASEAAAQVQRLLVDREAKVAAREREAANALRPYREARSRLLAAMDAVEKIPVLVLRAGEV